MSGEGLYPGKAGLSKFEAEQVRDHGAPPVWFEPWATHVVLFGGVVGEPFGIIHLHGEASDVLTWPTQDGLSRGLEALYRAHDKCHQCQGVLYFMADETRLRMVIELDEAEDEGADE